MLGPKVEMITADVGEGIHSQSQKLAVLVKSQLGFGDMITALRVGNEAFAALAHPFDWPADFGGGPCEHRFFGIMKLFHAKTAAHIRRYDSQLVLRNIENESAH